MKRILKLRKLFFAFAVVLGIGITTANAWSNSAAHREAVGVRANSTDLADTSIVFKSNTIDGSQIVNSITANNLVSSNTLVASATTITNIYTGKSGAKFGTKYNPGTLTLKLKSDSNTNIKTLSFVTAKYSSDAGTFSFKADDTTLKSEQTPGTDYTHTFDSPASITTLTIATSSKRGYLTSITATYESADPNKHTVQITSTEDNIQLKDGNTLTMTASCAQEDAVKWSSEDTNIATIDESTGVLTPVGEGSVVITATCSTDSTATATKTITVWKEPEVITNKTVAEVAALATKEDTKTLYQVTGFISSWYGTEDDGTAYGKYYLKDLDTTAKASLYVNGTTADSTALTYDYSTKSYNFDNPNDFLKNEITSVIKLGYRVTIKGFIYKVSTGVFALRGVITSVQDPVVFTALDVDTKNVKTTYNLLDEFDATGLVVHACDENMDNIRELTATTDYSWSPTKFETEGTIEVTVTGLRLYAGLTDTFNVVVKNIGFEISPNGDDIEAQTGDASFERSVINLTGFDTTEVAYEWTSSNTSAVTITNEESATATINIVGVGESTISIYVTDYTEELTKTFKVTVIEKQILFSKVTDTSELIPGKQVMIANSDGSKAMGSQANNNRKALSTTKNGNYIVKTDDLAVFTLLPAKDNGYAFYDETAEKMLSTASSSDNYLKTNGNYGNENAYVTVSVSTSDTTTTTSVVFKGSYTKNNLKYNSQSTIFSCYSSGQQAISIYIAVEGEPESIGNTWAKQFNTSANCDPTGARTLSSDTWKTLTNEFKEQSIPEKMAASYLDTGSSVATTDFVNAINSYEHCLTKYGYTGFINDRGATANSLFNITYRSSYSNTTILAVVLITFTSVTAIGGYMLIHKRKEN